MNHSKVHGIFLAMAMMIGSIFIAPAAAQQGPLGSQLAGAWDLVSIEVTAKDGTRRPGFGGPNAQGILILDPSGRYAQVTGNPVRPKLSTRVRKDVPAAELGEAARSFGARYGAWSVNEADKTLVLTSELGMLEPKPAARTLSVRVTGSELELVESRGGSKTRFVFRRAR